MNAEIVILPARGCRRSKKILEYLDEEGIDYQRIDLESPDGQRLTDEHRFMASPGILVDGEVINPYVILVRDACRVDTHRAQAVFHAETE